MGGARRTPHAPLWLGALGAPSTSNRSICFHVLVGVGQFDTITGVMGESAGSGRWLRAALWLGGAALFAFLIWQIGLRAILASFGELGWRLVIVLVFPFAIITAFDTL